MFNSPGFQRCQPGLPIEASHLFLPKAAGRSDGSRPGWGLLRIDTAFGDAGYDAEHNHSLCREDLGVRQTVIRLNRRNTGRRWPKTLYRRAMRHRFPKALYNRRWHAESGFSQHKRRLGSALTARGDEAQARELALRVLTHNLMLLADVA